MKNKSGDCRSSGKTWAYYIQMDNILRTCPYENAKTKSNLDECGQSTENEEGFEASNERSTKSPEIDDVPSTPKASTSATSTIPLVKTSNLSSTSDDNFRLRKKRRVNTEDSTTEKLLEILQSTGKDEDEFFHYGMTIAAKLRALPKKAAAEAQLKISNLLYEIEYNSPEIV